MRFLWPLIKSERFAIAVQMLKYCDFFVVRECCEWASCYVALQVDEMIYFTSGLRGKKKDPILT